MHMYTITHTYTHSLEIGKKKLHSHIIHLGFFPDGSDGKESACDADDLGSIPGSGRFLGGGHGNPLQYPCLENPMDRGAWWATVHGVTKE